MFMKKIISALSLFCVSISSSYAGFGLETTRVIYHEKDKSEGVVAFNTDKNRNYLLQSWVEDKKGNVTQDFAVTPPLVKLRAEQKNTIQLMKVSTLPSDKESLYWLNVKFVAPSSEDLEHVLRYSMTNKIKLIYRPTALSDKKVEESVNELAWYKAASGIKVNNPTPFYINIAKLKVNGKEVEAPSYLEPRSETTINIPKLGAGIHTISLNYINDYGKGLDSSYTIK
ncbi:molecular chaperone [Providencia stuartii]|nr:molecular chaperone [Providencia stuartii]EMD5258633.1 molecular chaperone [Providencia stuartii]